MSSLWKRPLVDAPSQAGRGGRTNQDRRLQNAQGKEPTTPHPRDTSRQSNEAPRHAPQTHCTAPLIAPSANLGAAFQPTSKDAQPLEAGPDTTVLPSIAGLFT